MAGKEKEQEKEQNDINDLLDELESDLEEDLPTDEDEEDEEDDKDDKDDEDEDDDSSDDAGDDKDEDDKDELSEVDQLKAQNDALLKQIEDQEKSGDTTIETEELEDPDKIDLFEGVDFQNLFETKENFTGFLSDFAMKVRKQAMLDWKKNAPDLISETANNQVTVREKVNGFYAKNKDLSQLRNYVAKIAGVVASEDPKLKVDDVMDEAAKRARKALGLPDPSDESDESDEKGEKKKKPKLPKPKGSVRGGKKSKMTDLQKEINELID